MASERGKAGKGVREGHDNQVHWLARDVRETDRDSQGKPAAQEGRQSRTRKAPECKNCQDLCCGLARAFISEAFGVGAITASRKVSLG